VLALLHALPQQYVHNVLLSVPNKSTTRERLKTEGMLSRASTAPMLTKERAKEQWSAALGRATSIARGNLAPSMCSRAKLVWLGSPMHLPICMPVRTLRLITLPVLLGDDYETGLMHAG
jgi:hypothetical protein